MLSHVLGVWLTRFTGRHKPVPGGLTVAVLATDTRETGRPNPFRLKRLKFMGNQKKKFGLGS